MGAGGSLSPPRDLADVQRQGTHPVHVRNDPDGADDGSQITGHRRL
jgi:hypothetical protein